MNMEYIRKNKKVLTKEFVDDINMQRKKNHTIVNREVYDQQNDILHKIEERKQRTLSLPHNKMEARIKGKIISKGS